MEPSEVDVGRSVPRHPDNVTFTDLDSPHDGNKCRLLRLPNGIEAILASDPAMQLSAAALIVCAGWLDDPVDCNGIAHLAEHCVARCIFDTGVAQPGQSEQTFEQLISQNGGCNSALVTSDYTMYAFAVAPTVFKYALDSFANIFKSSPSLSYETVGHEVLAVDAEFQKDRQIHAECIRNLNTYLARPESREYRCLEGGNYESLTDHVESQRKAICPIDSHDPNDAAVWESLRVRLFDWCEANYPTHQKYVAICGPESLDELAERVFESFSSIPNPSSPIGRIFSDKFNSSWADGHKDIVIFCTTPQALWTVDLCWVIPWSGTARDETSVAVLRYILTDSDVNSVFAQLHRRRWFETLQVYSEAGDMQDGYHYLRIRINLTELGWQNWRSVVHLVQSYLTLIRNEPPSQDVIDDALQVGRNSALHNECNPPVLAKVLVEKLWRVYPKNALFSSDFHHTVASFHEWVTKYLNSRDVRVILSGPSGWAKAGVAEEDWEILPRLGIKYRVARLAEYRNSPHGQDTGSDDLCLPKRNPFVPYTLAMHGLPDMEDLPSVDLIIRSESLLAYRQVVDIQDPRAYIVVVLDSPLLNTTEHQLSFQVYGRIIMERLKSTLNRATIAGTWPDLSVGTESVTMQVSGYPAYLIELLKTMWNAFFGFEAQVEPWEFDEQRDQVLRRLESEMHSCFGGLGLNIGDGSRAELRSLLSKRQFRPQTLATAMQDVSLASVRECVENISRNGYNVKIGLVGNLNASTIRSAVNLCVDGAKAPLKPEEWFDLPPGNFILEVTEPRQSHRPNQIYYFCRTAKDESYQLDFTARLIRYFVVATLFPELHSRYDIGHDFSANIHNGGGYLWIIIEGRTPRDPAYVERCIDQFLEDLLRTLENTPADEFAAILQNLEETRGDECRSSFEQESTAMMNYVSYQTEIAIKTGEPVSHMSHTDISQQDIVDLFRLTISPRSIDRSKISMRLYSSPRHMSIPAIHKVFDELSSRSIPIASDLENKLLTRLPLPMDSFVEAIQQELGGQMGSINIKHVVRAAAERYPVEDGEKGSASEELASIPIAPLIYVESVDELHAEITQRSRTTLGVERRTGVACHYRL